MLFLINSQLTTALTNTQLKSINAFYEYNQSFFQRTIKLTGQIGSI